MPIHVVKRGQQSMMYIAHEHGFEDWRTIWEHPDNAELRKGPRPRHPQMLELGTKVVIPSREEETWQPVATNERNTFRLQAAPRARVRVCLFDWTGEAYAYRDYTATIGAVTTRGETGPNGLVELEVPDDVKEVSLVVHLGSEQVAWRLLVGALEPAYTQGGVRGHLTNLGLLPGGFEADDAEAASALSAFRASRDLADRTTGEVEGKGDGKDHPGRKVVDTETALALERYSWIDPLADGASPSGGDPAELGRARGRRELLRDILADAKIGLAPWAMFATDADIEWFLEELKTKVYVSNLKDEFNKRLETIKQSAERPR
jgi:hypothetical protein